MLHVRGLGQAADRLSWQQPQHPWQLPGPPEPGQPSPLPPTASLHGFCAGCGQMTHSPVVWLSMHAQCLLAIESRGPITRGTALCNSACTSVYDMYCHS